MPWAAAAAAVGAIGGAVISSNGAKSAANTQAAATDKANAEQARQFDKLQENQRPYLDSGRSALQQYNTLLGVPPVGAVKQADGSYSTPAPAVDRNAIRAQLLPRFTTQGAGTLTYNGNPDAPSWTNGAGPSTVDEAGLNAAIEQAAAAGQQPGAAGAPGAGSAGGDTSSPEYGSYARPLTAAEVQLDPGYQFGLKQGQQGLDRKVAAAGGRISGAALKAAAEFGTDYGTTGYSTAYNRTNQARTDRLNRLAALAGIGQTATQQVGQAGMNTASIIGANTTAQGTAAGASQIAQGNIWAGAGNQIAALYGRNSSAPTQAYNPSSYSAPGGGDYYYGTGQNYGV